MARAPRCGTMDARGRPRMGLVILLVALTVDAAAMPLAGATSPPTAAAPANVAEGGDQSPLEEWVNSTAYITTSLGTIVASLADLDAPITVGNYVRLANERFYDNMRFHRIVDDFVIQTGDPNSRDNNPYNDGTGGSAETITLEISENLTHEDGALGMARSSDPNSASSQFYICDGAQHGLDGNYAVFGFVVSGIDVVRAIAAVPVNGNKRPLIKEQPVDDVWLYGVSVTLGHWNETEPTGPSEPVDGGGILGAAGGSGVAALVAAPVVILVTALLSLRWRRRRAMVKTLSAAYR